MASDEEYTSLLGKIFPPNIYPVVYDELLLFKWKTTVHHKESFREHCLTTAHFMDEYCRENNLLQDTWNGITYARLVGFCHDIGKPFVVKNTKKDKQFFTGHAQVGARLFYLRFKHEIDESNLLTMATAIDSHMCILRSNKIPRVGMLRTNSVMHMYLPSCNVLPILKCLHRADAMGKIPQIENEQPTYLPESPLPYRKSNKIVIYLIGPSGSGKSTMAAALAAQLSPFGSVKLLERDAILMDFALEGETYEECRKRVYNDPLEKLCFQERWKRKLNSTNSQIVLIDTVQNYYHTDTQTFSHHFRIGLYCFPMNFIDSSLHGKAPEFEFPPHKWAGYPTVLGEVSKGPWQLEIGTGIWQWIPPLVKRYLDRCESLPLELQPTLATLWEKYSGYESIAAHFNPLGITFATRYAFSDVEIIRVSYFTDVTYGPTRYYRGEYLLKTRDGVSMLRSGLPTFRKEVAISESFQKIVVTPKYDGSLVNILYVPKEYKHFQLLQEQFPDAYYEKYGLLFIGSKQTLIMENSLRERFDTAIGMDFQDFIAHYAQHFKDKMITLHFEMMVEQNHEELTVYYPNNFCKFIGYTTFTDTTRTFTLPDPKDPRAVEQIEFDNLQQCEKYMKQQHRKLLDGDMDCEPEGFVLYVYEDGLKDIVKRKFLEYYVAHKPKHYPEAFKRLFSNPKLMERFQKCRQIKNFEMFKLKSLIETLQKLLPDTQQLYTDRKLFAFHLIEKRVDYYSLQCKLDELTTEFKMDDINLKRILWINFPDKDAMIREIQKPFESFMIE